MDNLNGRENPIKAEDDSLDSKKVLNNLNKKIENELSNNLKEKSNDFNQVSNTNIIDDEEKQCCNKKDVLQPLQTDRVYPLRNRNKNFKPPILPKCLAETKVCHEVNDNMNGPVQTELCDRKGNEKKKSDNEKKWSENEKDAVWSTSELGAVALSKLNYDIKIDPNVVDRYTNKASLLPRADESSDKKIKMEEENMAVARQCRLHPANKKYNQGPVVNPPPISPGIRVGYTPAGQRHEVDLNAGRPTWFNSEYARMQFDDATKINASRMIHDLEMGMFLPDSLNPNVERRHLAERALVNKDATEHFEKNANDPENSEPEMSDAETDDLLKVITDEMKMIELNRFAVLKFKDFPEEMNKRLQNALSFKMRPLIFLKNPIFVETIEKLSRQSISSEVARSARILLTKIQALFNVPESKTFLEHFQSEVESFKKKTEHMNSFDVFMMTKEPVDIDIPSEESCCESDEESAQQCQTTLNTNQNIVIEDPVITPGDNYWVPVVDGDHWIDLPPDEVVNGDGDDSSDVDLSEDDCSDAESEMSGDVDGCDGDPENDDDSYTEYDDDSFTEEEQESDDYYELGMQDAFLEMQDAIVGMILSGIPATMIVHYFEYI